ncbi:MAG: rhodanese-like domain-containing protein [Bacteroidota bacterium]
MKSFKITQSPVAYAATTLLYLQSLTGFSQINPSLVDFDAYETLVSEVKEHRKSHMLNAEEFKTTGKEEKVIILDTRSDSMYTAAHVKGAIHLNFSDFTQANLAKIIPSPDYKILIYCNNNFESKPSALSINNLNLEPYFVTKVSKPMVFNPVLFDSKAITKPKHKTKPKTKAKSGPNDMDEAVVEALPVTAKPITLALNIPTYINLYGYGYRHIYELSELVNTNSGILEFEGTAIPIKDPNKN